MHEDRRREVALFRYSLCREPGNPGLSRVQRGRLVRALAAAEHVGPDGERVRVGRSTLDKWIVAWQAGGFDALLPRAPVVGPRTPAPVLALAEALKRELPARTVAQVRAVMLAAGEPAPSQSTLERHFRRLGLNVRPDGRAPRAYGRFEASARNELWTGDGERHEALWNRAVVKGHRGQFVAANWHKLGAA